MHVIGLMIGAVGQSVFLMDYFSDLSPLIVLIVSIPCLVIFTITFTNEPIVSRSTFRKCLLFTMIYYGIGCILAEATHYFSSSTSLDSTQVIVSRVMMYLGSLSLVGFIRPYRELGRLLRVGDQEFSAFKASLAANDLVAKIDGLLADMCEAEVESRNRDVLEEALRLAAVGIKTIAQLETALQDLHPIIVAFGKRWLSRKHKRLASGVSLLYLWYVLIARDRSLREIRQMLKDHGVGQPEERDQLAQAILDSYRAAVEDLSGAGPGPAILLSNDRLQPTSGTEASS